MNPSGAAPPAKKTGAQRGIQTSTSRERFTLSDSVRASKRLGLWLFVANFAFEGSPPLNKVWRVDPRMSTRATHRSSHFHSALSSRRRRGRDGGGRTPGVVGALAPPGRLAGAGCTPVRIGGATVTVACPLIAPCVAVMCAFPALLPVTSPLASTLATVAASLVQATFAVTSLLVPSVNVPIAVNWVVSPTRTLAMRRQMIAAAEAHYAAADQPAAFFHTLFDGGHSFPPENSETAYAWLDRWPDA
jgi:hypothetical protein